MEKVTKPSHLPVAGARGGKVATIAPVEGQTDGTISL
jgi:hypothetical protein